MDESQALAKIDKIFSNPMVQGYMKFLTNPALAKGASLIVNNPHKMNLVYFEIAWFILYSIFRTWSKIKIGPLNVPILVIFGFLCTMGYLVVAAVFIPSYVFGPTYSDLMTELYRAAFK